MLRQTKNNLTEAIMTERDAGCVLSLCDKLIKKKMTTQWFDVGIIIQNIWIREVSKDAVFRSYEKI